MFNKTLNSIFYNLPNFQIKNKAHTVEKFRELSFDRKIFVFSSSGYISEIWIVSLLLDVSKIPWNTF